MPPFLFNIISLGYTFEKKKKISESQIFLLQKEPINSNDGYKIRGCNKVIYSSCFCYKCLHT